MAMLMSKLCIIAGGFLSLFMVLFHTRFYHLFYWKEEFEQLTVRSRKIVFTIHVALILLFLVFALLSLFLYEDLAQCQGLALALVALYALFWLWRAVWQVVYFWPQKGGGRAMLMLHFILIVVFLLLFAAYAAPVIIRLYTVYHGF